MQATVLPPSRFEANGYFKRMRSRAVGTVQILPPLADITAVQRAEGKSSPCYQELTGHMRSTKDRGPIMYEDVSEMTDEQVEQELRLIIGIKDADVQPSPDSEQ